MLTKQQISDAASDTLKEHGIGLVNELRKGELYDGRNLVALMELFAQKLDAADSPDIVAVIDARMGGGWARGLAEALSK